MPWLSGSPERTAARVAPAALLLRLDERLARAEPTRIALLVIVLSPVDRSMATAEDRAARRVRSEVERRVREVLHPNDCYAFVSGEEIWAMLPNLPGDSVAELAGGTLLERLRRPIATVNARGAPASRQLDPSVGGACAPAGAGVVASVLLPAACTSASLPRTGDGRIRLRRLDAAAGAAPAAGAAERELGRALDWNELDVHFQPQVELRSGRCLAAEALIRWHRPDGASVSPAAIVELCEKHELIGQLTRFTLNNSLRRLSEWRDEGLSMTVAINLSATSLSDPGFPLLVEQALDTWGVPAAGLTLELTESALIRNERAASDTMRRLHEIGCRLSIDDFGTGYSPYTYLRQFSFDELKIDQAFVRRMNSEPADRKIVRSLVELAHAFGMQAVGEGVEEASTQDALREIGCDLAQGWHLSPALPADAFAAWCRARDGVSDATPDTMFGAAPGHPPTREAEAV